MENQKKCETCGGEIPQGLPSTLCPHCALQTALLQDEQQAPIRVLPTQIGSYELIEEIARGAMGVVYKARQKSLDRIVALKMILAGEFASAEHALRFRIEAEAAARLQHPNIVRIHETGEQNGLPYFSMDYVEGGNLAALVHEKPLSAKRAAIYVKTIAQAIHYAHEQGILHRDLKPSNVLIDDADQPRITDFGLAKRMTKESFLTVTNEVLGSPSFMPPEQCGYRSQHKMVLPSFGDTLLNAEDVPIREAQTAPKVKAGRYSDVYGLGAILFYLVTGRPPFVADTVAETLHHVLNTEPVSPRLLNPSVPQDLATICLKCLEKEPGNRYATAEDVAMDIQRHLHNEPLVAQSPGTVYRFKKFVRRNKLAVGMAVVLALGSSISTWQAIRATRAEQTQSRLREAAQRAQSNEIQLRQQAEIQELAARRKSYASDINLAQQSLTMNNLGRGRELLDRHRPELGQRDLRGWEWRYLWQECQSDELRTLGVRSNEVNSISVSPDGKLLAVTEHLGGGLSIWNLRTMEEMMRLPAGDGPVRASFSPREPLLAFTSVVNYQSSWTTDQKFRIQLWDSRLGRILGELTNSGLCAGLAFSADGRVLVSLTRDPERALTLWRIPEGSKLASFPADQSQYAVGNTFVLAPDSTKAAHATVGGAIRVVDLVTGTALWSTRGAEEHITALAFSPDAKTLASGAGFAETAIRLWDVASGTEVGRLEGHRGWVASLMFLPDGNTLVSASADQTIRLWNLSRMQSRGILRGHRGEIWSLAMLRDSSTLVSGSKDGAIKLWDLSSQKRKRDPILPIRPLTWRFSKDSKSVFTLDESGQVAQWSGRDFKHCETVIKIGAGIYGGCIAEDNSLLAVGITNGALQIWDLSRRQVLTETHNFTGPVRPLRFLSNDSRLVLLNRRDQSLHEYQLAPMREARSWIVPRGVTWRDARWAAISEDERWCLALGYRGQCLLKDLLTGLETNPILKIGQAGDCAFSPDGKVFAVPSHLGYVKIWKTATFEEVATLRGFMLGVHSVAFSPDGKRLAAGSNGNEAIKLFDSDSSQELIALPGEGSVFSTTEFSPDGSVLGSMNSQGLLHLWRAPSWSEIDAVEKLNSSGGN